MPRANPSRQTVLAAAGIDEDALPTAADFDAALPADLEFEPVPRRAKRSNGLTPERQRIFIAMLAQTGSVRTACAGIGCSSHAIYHLRHSPGAESFAAAWDKAVERGARRVLDILVDQAINGTPEKIYKDGELVAERRVYNTRAMMWIVAHYLPDRFGVTGGLMHSAGAKPNLGRLKAAWRKEWQEERDEARRAEAERDAETNRSAWATVRQAFKRRLAHDPERRAAWELLTGPTDWGDLTALTRYPGLPDNNMHRPDVVVAMAGLARGKRAAGEEGA